MSHQDRSQEMQQCIDNCQSCHAVCLKTIGHCLKMGGEHASAAHIKLLQDCVQSCQMSADFMIKMSNFHPQVCGVCADICEACAKECESMAHGVVVSDDGSRAFIGRNGFGDRHAGAASYAQH